MKLKQKIIIIALEIGLIPLFLVGFIGYYNLQQQAIDGTLSKLDAIAQIQKNRLQSNVQDKLDLFNLFASKPLLRQYLRDYNRQPSDRLQTAMINNLAEAQANVAGIKGVFVANLAGLVVAATDRGLLGQNISGQAFFQSGLKRPDVSHLAKDSSGKVISQYLAGPLILNKQVLGVAVIVGEIDDILSVSQDYTGLGASGETLLAENDGQGDALFLTPTRFNADTALTMLIAKNRTNVPSVSAVAGKEGVFTAAVDYRNVPVFAATRYLPSVGWGIVVKLDRAEALASIQKLQGLFLLLLIVTAIFIVFIGLVTARSISEPILALTVAADKIKQGNWEQKIKLNTGDEIGALGQALNIMATKLKKSYATMEQTVAERTQDLAKFKLAVENASDHIVITDPEGVVLFANKAAEKITGFAVKEILGKKVGTKALWGGMMGQAFYAKMWRTIKQDKKVFTGELTNHRKNGENYIAQASISPITDKAGQVIFFVALERDITKEKAIDKAKSEFVSLASHQLRTPLSAVKWTLEAINDNEELPDSVKTRLADVYGSNERLISLVNELLNVSHIEEGKVIIKKEPADIGKLIDEALTGLKINAAKKEQTLNLTGNANLVPVRLDVIRFGEVFNNLVANAINYAPTKARIEIAVAEDKKNYIISVHNNEPIIPLADQKNLFTKFYRGTNIEIVNTTGSGLGLFIAKAAAEENGGKIWFESKEGRGTTFFFTIPKK